MFNPSLQMIKEVDKNIATVDEIINYTITMTNNGDVDITTINFLDIVGVEGSFVDGSVVIDTTSYPDYNPNLGIVLGPLGISETTILSFQVRIGPLVRPRVTISNKATATYNYIGGVETSESNTVVTNINAVVVTATKSSPSQVINNTFTSYTATIENKGSVDLNNVFFIDPLPDNVTFRPNSVRIASVSYPTYDPTEGFYIDRIWPIRTVTITFQVTPNILSDED